MFFFDYFFVFKICCVNVVDFFKLISYEEYFYGLINVEYEVIFMGDKLVVFNFYSYFWLVYWLIYGWKNVGGVVVRGYKEKGNIDMLLELVIRNGIDRFFLVMEVIDWLSEVGGVLEGKGGEVRELLRNE